MAYEEEDVLDATREKSTAELMPRISVVGGVVMLPHLHTPTSEHEKHHEPNKVMAV